eukprot:TRINITY_DN2152_c0_g2_i1.p1 TRINITY_DN2152_c0_g2~~TRINITY_DN2152_c0_g2_i1.p1  ORF type:complete len:399 (-),score=123.38 TRINITY_DN2152_c0_g2_i1:99-1295(-)
MIYAENNNIVFLFGYNPTNFLFFFLNSIVTDVCFHPEGHTIAGCSSDNSIKLWDVRSGQIIQHYKAHDKCVNKISFHPSGNFLLSGSDDSVLKIWDIREGHLLYSLKAHKKPVFAVAFSSDGSKFVSGGGDKHALVWDSHLPSEIPVEESVMPSEDSRISLQMRSKPSGMISQKQQQQQQQPVPSTPARNNLSHNMKSIPLPTPTPTPPPAAPVFKGDVSPARELSFSVENENESPLLETALNDTVDINEHFQALSLPHCAHMPVEHPSSDEQQTLPSNMSVTLNNKSTLDEQIQKSQQPQIPQMPQQATLSPEIKGAMEFMVSQIRLLTESMGVLQERVTLVEDKLALVAKHSKCSCDVCQCAKSDAVSNEMNVTEKIIESEAEENKVADELEKMEV